MSVDPRTHARSTDPVTSHDAAARLSDKATMMRRLLRAHYARPLTAEEASDLCGYDAADGAWKRVSDLANAGLIEDTGQRRTARSGREQVVRAITEAGREALR